MKKIKKKTRPNKTQALPAFVIGYSHSDAPPPGYLAAWFNQMYGGPLHVHFIKESGHSQFEAVHTTWRVAVNTALPADAAKIWQQRLQWSHSQLAEVTSLKNVGQDKRDVALHTARIARGISLLTEGTAYDVVTHTFLNPSDWNDRPLDQFDLEDHVRVEQKENIDSYQMWFYTLGLAKFGLEEIETFRPLGLGDQPVIDQLLAIGNEILSTGKVAKVGDQLTLRKSGQLVIIVRHRTDQSTGRVIQLREVKWE
ncbi:MAG: hypothetical protein JSU59_08460 [Nitrospirota bacterium]|nr:MAG: hypothetical protein JSU59_08460 [Nitrospirota bacterium]